jgi:hypothetical protein
MAHALSILPIARPAEQKVLNTVYLRRSKHRHTADHHVEPEVVAAITENLYSLHEKPDLDDRISYLLVCYKFLRRGYLLPKYT